MNDHNFYEAVHNRSKKLNINPVLLLSGIEGLYTFKDVQLNAINFELLDSLILTIFALRIGDQFHSLAEENLNHPNAATRLAAAEELKELTENEIQESPSSFLQSFAQVIGGKSPVRNYHIKALEVSALEIRKAQLAFKNESIGLIMLEVCKDDPENELGLASFF